MPKKSLGISDYVNAAFSLKVPVGPLGYLPLNYLALGTCGFLGFLNPGFWLLGMAGEFTYLYTLSTNVRFQNYVKGLELQKIKDSWTARLESLIDRMDWDNKDLFSSVKLECESILTEDVTGEFLDSISSEINNLLFIFAKMLLLKQRTDLALQKADEDSIHKSINNLLKRLGKEDSESIKNSIQSNIDIQSQRLKNIENSRESLRLTEIEIERIRNQISLISEEIVLKKNPEQLSTALNGVVRSIQDTSSFVSQHSGLLESIEIQSPNFTVKN